MTVTIHWLTTDEKEVYRGMPKERVYRLLNYIDSLQETEPVPLTIDVTNDNEELPAS